MVIGACVAAWHYTPLSELVTAERVRGWARAVREAPWAPFALIIAYTPAAFVMFPRPLLTLFAIVAFGPWLGFAYSMIGIVLSALVTYYAGRALSRATVKRIAGERLEHVSKSFREHGLFAITAMRLLPAAPFGVEGVVAGAFRINVWQFTLGTAIGMTPGVLAMAVFGQQLTNALEDPSTVNYWIVAGVLVALSAIMYVASRWLASKTKQTQK